MYLLLPFQFWCDSGCRYFSLLLAIESCEWCVGLKRQRLGVLQRFGKETRTTNVHGWRSVFQSHPFPRVSLPYSCPDYNGRPLQSFCGMQRVLGLVWNASEPVHLLFAFSLHQNCCCLLCDEGDIFAPNESQRKELVTMGATKSFN